jgi:D-cysteine desulfhydrase
MRPPQERIAQYVDKQEKPPLPPKDGKAYLLNTSPEVSLEYFPALFYRYPELCDLPWVSLRGCEVPSVPIRLQRSQHLFGENYAFMKRESLDFHALPDNKARKLEFVLGDVLRRKRKKLVTFGYVGSSHCLATAQAASQLSLKSEVILLKCPLTVEALEMVAIMKALGTTVRLRSTMRGVYWTAAWKWLCSKIFRTELVAPGGSNGFGVLGYVSAMTELRSQIDDGSMPEPDYLFVAAGSGATIVGMEIGRRMLNLRTKIIGIQTSEDKGVDPTRLLDMSNAAIETLNRHLKSPLGFSLQTSDFTILKDFLFGGHGQTPPELDRWVAQFLELERVELEPVYTAKALYGASQFCLKNNLKGKTILLWNTCSPYRKAGMSPKFSWNKLSFRLKKWVRDDQSHGRLAQLG